MKIFKKSCQEIFLKRLNHEYFEQIAKKMQDRNKSSKNGPKQG